MRTHFSLPTLSLCTVALLFGLLIWLDPQSAHTQAEPFQLFQLTAQRESPVGSHPSGFTAYNGAIYFGLASQVGGLWQTDGTEAGTILVKDVQMDPTTLQQIDDLLYFGVWDNLGGGLWQSNGTPDGTKLVKAGFGVRSRFLVVGDHFYFAGTDTEHGTELWRSDGTPNGTALVTDAIPGASSLVPQQFVSANGLIYFIGYDASFTYFRLWQSDGSAAGTRLVDNVPTRIPELAVLENVLYFVSIDAFGSYGLWRYAGEAAGPTLIHQFYPNNSTIRPTQFIPWQDGLFFAASDGAQGTSLWRTDGTPAGTSLIKDLYPEITTETVTRMTLAANQLYFLVGRPTQESTLWKSDGTAVGTLAIKPVPHSPSIEPGRFVTAGDLLYFVLRDPNDGRSLWRSDGTPDGTTLVVTAGVMDVTAVNNRLYLSIADAARGAEFWVSDGTTAGTRFVKELNPNHNGPSFGSTALAGDRFYGVIYNVSSAEEETDQLWMSSGPAARAMLIDEVPIYSYELAAAGEVLFLKKQEVPPALWAHSGGTAAPTLVQQFDGVALTFLTEFNNQLFFFIEQSEYTERELWRSDGTATGTVRLIDNLGTVTSPLLQFGDQLVLGHNTELWFTDGTPAGTTHFTPSGISGSIVELASADTVFYFATSQPNGTQVWWRSDGTVAGTVPLSVGAADFTAYESAAVGNALYLVGRTDVHGVEIWYTSGTSSVIVRLTNTPDAGAHFGIRWLTPLHGQLYFVMNDGTHGPELWKSDSTTGGTILVKDIAPPAFDGLFEAYPGPLLPFQDKLYFAAHDGRVGRELWQSDGTAAGTMLLKDINVGPNSASPEYYISRDDRFFFPASDGIHGRELWQSDGTPAGTTLVTDLFPGSADAYPFPYFITADSLYFAADNGRDGRQIFNLYTGTPLALPPAEEPTPATTEVHRLYLPAVNR